MTTTTETRTRGPLLTAWLIFMLVANTFTFFAYISIIQDWLNHSDPAWDRLGVPSVILTIGAAINIVAALLLWRWKIWGLYLFIGVSVVALVINLAIGTSFLVALFGLTGVAILFALVNPKREWFT